MQGLLDRDGIDQLLLYYCLSQFVIAEGRSYEKTDCEQLSERSQAVRDQTKIPMSSSVQ